MGQREWNHTKLCLLSSETPLEVQAVTQSDAFPLVWLKLYKKVRLCLGLGRTEMWNIQRVYSTTRAILANSPQRRQEKEKI